MVAKFRGEISLALNWQLYPAALSLLISQAKASAQFRLVLVPQILDCIVCLS